MPRICEALLALCLLAGCAGAPPGREPVAAMASESARWQAHVAAFMPAYWRQHPGQAVFAGVYEHAGQLPAPTAAERARTLAWLDRQLAALDTFDPRRLGPDERTDLTLLRRALDGERWALTRLQAWQWDPSGYRVAAPFELLLEAEGTPLELRLRALLARLAQVPAFYAAAQANIQRPTLEHTDLAIRQSQGSLATFGEPLLARVRASALTAGEKAEFETRARAAQAAIQGWTDFLQQMRPALVAGGARSFRLGPELYAEKFAHDSDTGFSVESLYQRAGTEKASLHAQMADRATLLWPKYFGTEAAPADPLLRVRRLLDRLSLEHVRREDFVDEVRRQLPRLEAFVREKDLLDQDASRPLKVRELPPYMRGQATASVSAPGPYDAQRDTFYNVAALGDYTPGQAESFLREHNRWMLQILNIHEAIPGHYTQLVHANKSASIVKSVFGDGAMVEGWAVYGERMMLLAGYGNDEPELWLFWMKWNLRSVCNVLLDIGVHTRGLTREAALDLLQREAFQQETEAVEKWRRATQNSVQLTTYFAGYAAIWQLRLDEEKRLGPAFDLKAFHNRFLSYGRAPVPLIRALMAEGR